MIILDYFHLVAVLNYIKQQIIAWACLNSSLFQGFQKFKRLLWSWHSKESVTLGKLIALQLKWKNTFWKRGFGGVPSHIPDASSNWFFWMTYCAFLLNVGWNSSHFLRLFMEIRPFSTKLLLKYMCILSMKWNTSKFDWFVTFLVSVLWELDWIVS